MTTYQSDTVQEHRQTVECPFIQLASLTEQSAVSTADVGELHPMLRLLRCLLLNAGGVLAKVMWKVWRPVHGVWRHRAKIPQQTGGHVTHRNKTPQKCTPKSGWLHYVFTHSTSYYKM